ncbi:MAG TPA: sugar ABC transporter substrate-binding protein [Streptosporangiaceae bacterium]|jgi:simple sugar transport system substrate-binding protein/ribose transport system substrate-binding protein
MRKTITAGAALLSAALAVGLTGCGTTSEATKGAGGVGKVGVILPFLTSPFWQAYNGYIKPKAKDVGVQTLPTVNSGNDSAQQITDMNNLLNQNVKALVVAPIDSAAIAAGIKQANRKGVPVVAVDVAPESGKVAMIVRADNVAYGNKACKQMGDRVKSGKVVQIQGDLASVNGRDRSQAFSSCMAKNYPKIKVINLAAGWLSDKAASMLNDTVSSNKDIKGIYSQAGGVYLAPTLSTLKRTGMLKKAGQPGHVVIVSNDGIPQEYKAIRQGYVDATVSQPADDYAKWGLWYAKQAMMGKTFKPGPTDHNSTIVKLPSGNLEDQLPAPVVTKQNVDDPKLWGNTLGH